MQTAKDFCLKKNKRQPLFQKSWQRCSLSKTSKAPGVLGMGMDKWPKQRANHLKQTKNKTAKPMSGEWFKLLQKIYMWGVLKTMDPHVTMGFNAKMVQFWMTWGTTIFRTPPGIFYDSISYTW